MEKSALQCQRFATAALQDLSLIHIFYPRDRVITVLEMTKDIMAAESGPGRSLLVQRMLKKHVNLICEATVEKVEKDKIYYTKNAVSYTHLAAADKQTVQRINQTVHHRPWGYPLGTQIEYGKHHCSQNSLPCLCLLYTSRCV